MGPAARDTLLPDIVGGMADIIIINLIVMDERSKFAGIMMADQVGTETTTYVRNI